MIEFAHQGILEGLLNLSRIGAHLKASRLVTPLDKVVVYTLEEGFVAEPLTCPVIDEEAINLFLLLTDSFIEYWLASWLIGPSEVCARIHRNIALVLRDFKIVGSP